MVSFFPRVSCTHELLVSVFFPFPVVRLGLRALSLVDSVVFQLSDYLFMLLLAIFFTKTPRTLGTAYEVLSRPGLVPFSYLRDCLRPSCRLLMIPRASYFVFSFLLFFLILLTLPLYQYQILRFLFSGFGCHVAMLKKKKMHILMSMGAMNSIMQYHQMRVLKWMETKWCGSNVRGMGFSSCFDGQMIPEHDEPCMLRRSPGQLK